jgi:crotonobetainyl-CoA:carnitine CoA-transferase CaiB-like acyl-CoA transferase
MQEALITYYLENHPVIRWQVMGENPGRTGRISDLLVPLGVFPCKNGWIAVGVLTPQEWDSLSKWIFEVTGNRDILVEKYRADFQNRMDNRDVIFAIITEFLSRFNKEELFDEGQKRNLIVGGMKYPLGIFAGDVPVKQRSAPLLGQHNKEIYGNELGFSKEELAVLRNARVI